MSRRALEVAERTDSPTFQATALRTLADVLARAGKNEAAAETFRRALELEEERGAALQVARTRELLAELSA
jgi:hypothetical protein